MKRLFCCLLLIVFVASLVPLASESLPSYAPYEEDEFPIWTYKLRRADILFFGSLAITLPLAAGGYALASNYLAVPDSSSARALLIQAGVASAISLGIVLADYIVGEVQGDS